MRSAIAIRLKEIDLQPLHGGHDHLDTLLLEQRTKVTEVPFVEVADPDSICLRSKLQEHPLEQGGLAATRIAHQQHAGIQRGAQEANIFAVGSVAQDQRFASEPWGSEGIPVPQLFLDSSFMHGRSDHLQDLGVSLAAHVGAQRSLTHSVLEEIAFLPPDDVLPD